MIDPERILGQLLTGSLARQTGRGSGRATNGPGVGMGLLGVAIAAYEHFSEQQGQASNSASSPPSLQPVNESSPPPPPGAVPLTAGSIPPPAPDGEQDLNRKPATWLIRAMVAAAFADGVIDEQERSGIVRRVEQSGMGGDAVRFIEAELAGPRNLDEIATAASIFGMRKEFYAASISAIAVDSDAEKHYLTQLQHKLALSEAEVRAIQQQSGV